MKWTKVVVIAAGALSLGSGCVTTNQLASQVVSSVKESCNYLPQLTSIAAILGAPGAPQANELVAAICKGVLEAKQKRAGILTGQKLDVVVYGRTVTGEVLR